MKLGNWGEPFFSLAQAFTPGTGEGNGFPQPPLGGFRFVEQASPLEGGYTLYWILPPRRKRLGYGKTPLPTLVEISCIIQVKPCPDAKFRP